jgi:hypothetical protein
MPASESIMTLWRRLFGPAKRSPLLESGFRDSLLANIPPEMVIMIADSLPLASASSFALCCRSVYFILGTRYWEHLQLSNQKAELRGFLSILEREMPDHIPCYHCNVLHYGPRIYDLIRRRSFTMPCFVADTSTLMRDVFHYYFGFQQLSLMMKYHRLGYYCGNLQWSMRFNPHISSGFYTTIETRIISGSYFLRKQLRYLINIHQTRDFLTKLKARVCVHHSTVCDARLLESIPCQTAYIHNPSLCVKHGEPTLCSYCPTEYQIDLRECGRERVAVYITIWMDLGEGRSILDPKWWSRLDLRYTNLEAFSGAIDIYRKSCPEERGDSSFQAYSISSLFEPNGQLAFDKYDLVRAGNGNGGVGTMLCLASFDRPWFQGYYTECPSETWW